MMFGLPSLSKIAVLAFVIGLIIYLPKFLRRIQSIASHEQHGNKDATRNSQQSKEADAQPTLDMVRCESCDLFVPANMLNDCPQHGNRDGC